MIFNYFLYLICMWEETLRMFVWRIFLNVCVWKGHGSHTTHTLSCTHSACLHGTFIRPCCLQVILGANQVLMIKHRFQERGAWCSEWVVVPHVKHIQHCWYIREGELLH